MVAVLKTVEVNSPLEFDSLAFRTFFLRPTAGLLILAQAILVRIQGEELLTFFNQYYIIATCVKSAA